MTGHFTSRRSTRRAILSSAPAEFNSPTWTATAISTYCIPTGTFTTLEDKPYAFKVTDFGFADSSDTPPNPFLAVTIITLPTLGTLSDNGVAVAVGSHVTVADIAAGKLKFTPLTNGKGAAYASFTFKVQDNGGTANGGVDTDLTPKMLTISVT